MGCDIHMVVQVRKGDAWETVKWPNAYFGKYDDEAETTTQLRLDRNYVLFSVLASVRQEGDQDRFTDARACRDWITPIADQRGLPTDYVESEEYETGDHSFTWLTLAEVLSYDWETLYKERGIVDLLAYAAWRRGGERKPGSWCKRVNRTILSSAEADALVRNSETRLGDLWRDYAYAEWEYRLDWSCDEFCRSTIPSLKLLGKPEDVRLVMGFDS